jgi:uncharacterized membrane protein
MVYLYEGRILNENRRSDMAEPDAVFIYIGTYPNKAAAQADYEVVKGLHAADLVGTYEAAVVTKDEEGKVHLHEHEPTTERAGWGGAVAGALIGIVFPPVIPGTALAGAAVGAAIAHLWRGLSRSDVKELGELIDQGEATLLVVGEGTLDHALDEAALKAEKHVTKELDVLWKDVDKAVREAAKEVS